MREDVSGASDALCENRLTRADAVVALGGGVAGDLTGFAASTICVGSGLSDPDDAAGHGRFLRRRQDGHRSACREKIWPGRSTSRGSCSATRTVWIPLPDEIFRDGCAEVINTRCLEMRRFFELNCTPPHAQLEHIIETCVRMKRDIVAQDEF